MPKDLRERAEVMAVNYYGFSSLQELLRVFLNKLAAKRINILFEETVALSPEAEKRYLKMDKDFKAGRNVYRTANVDDLIGKLHGNRLS
ncbi:hypothetical protein FJZ40_00515 [Candidatus Shapirobacteria bacterium]|nr:hypothetical protein [Candidatus Shapirobacteria bacterium]